MGDGLPGPVFHVLELKGGTSHVAASLLQVSRVFHVIIGITQHVVDHDAVGTFRLDQQVERILGRSPHGNELLTGELFAVGGSHVVDILVRKVLRRCIHKIPFDLQGRERATVHCYRRGLEKVFVGRLHGSAGIQYASVVADVVVVPLLAGCRGHDGLGLLARPRLGKQGGRMLLEVCLCHVAGIGIIELLQGIACFYLYAHARCDGVAVFIGIEVLNL